jgi:phosphotriesterase-related protein
MQPPMILQDVDAAVTELEAFTHAGGQAIAEMTVHGWGRDVAALKEISTRSGVHVIATSGFYVEACHPAFVAHASVEELEALLIKELTAGADGTPIRTGLLKSGISRPVIEGPEHKCALAIARAQRHTGAAITTHSPAAARFEVAGGNLGLMLLNLFEVEGVDPARVIIGHTDSNPDVRQLATLAKRGAYVEFDLVGRTQRLLDETRIELLCRLVDMGYADRLLLSSDICRVADWKIHGGAGYDYVLLHFVPRLYEAGFDDSLIRRILIENPARVLSIKL